MKRKNMAKINFVNKVAVNENTNIPDVNKCKASDLNEIKEVVNQNDDNVGNPAYLNTTSKNVVGAINEVHNNVENLKPVILYENSSGVSSGSITLSNVYTNYEKIEVATNMGVTGVIYPSHSSQVRMSASIYIDTLYTFYLRGEFSSNKLTIQNNGTYYSNSNHTDHHKIFKIVGYKKSND